MNAKELIEQYADGKRDFRNANLREADLRGANLREANLRGANLRGADLWRADLREANLRGANLREANLRGADLRGADLQEANLQGANLRGADLQGVRYIWQCGPGGSNQDMLTVNMHPDGIRIYRGCFVGTLPEFITAVQNKNADDPTRTYYEGIIAFLHVLQALWREQMKEEE